MLAATPCFAAVQWGEIDASFGLQSGDAAMYWDQRSNVSGMWGPTTGFTAAEWVHRGSTSALLSNNSLLTLDRAANRIGYSSLLSVEPGSQGEGESGLLFSMAYGQVTSNFTILSPMTFAFEGHALATLPYYNASEVRLAQGTNVLFDWLHEGETGPESDFATQLELAPGSYTLTFGAVASAFSATNTPVRADAALDFEINLVAEPGAAALAFAAMTIGLRRRR